MNVLRLNCVFLKLSNFITLISRNESVSKAGIQKRLKHREQYFVFEKLNLFKIITYNRIKHIDFIETM